MIRPRLLFSTWILLLALCTCGYAQLKDYSSQGRHFSLLKDVRLGVTSIEHTGSQQISIEGFILNVSTFKLITKEPVPFIQVTGPYNNVVKDIEIHYELMVGEDRENVVHDKLIEVLNEISSMPAAERDFSHVGMSGAGKNYLLFSGPASMPNHVWFDGRIFVSRFLRLGEQRRDRALNTETFWKGKIGFFSGGKKILPSKVPKSFAADFVKRYANGEYVRKKR